VVAVAVKGLERWGEGSGDGTTSQGQGEEPRSGATNRPSVPATGAEECATKCAEKCATKCAEKTPKVEPLICPPKISGSTPGKAKLLETFINN